MATCSRTRTAARFEHETSKRDAKAIRRPEVFALARLEGPVPLSGPELISTQTLRGSRVPRSHLRVTGEESVTRWRVGTCARANALARRRKRAQGRGDPSA